MTSGRAMNETNSTQTIRAQLDLREKIVAGELPPGSRLLDDTLADEIGISRTPIRDALSRLAEEGLLERGARGGFVVRSFSVAEALDAIELRGVLEGTAARLAAERGVPLDVMAQFENIVDRMDEACGDDRMIANLESYSRLNERFHARLRALSGSTIIEREIERVTSLPFASPSTFIYEKSDDARFRVAAITAQAQHRAIAVAICRREGARAEAVTREHAWIARQNLEEALASDRIAIRHLPGLALVVD